MNYAIKQRLRFIDFLLAQYGHVNRIAIMNYFGTGSASASRDFRAYEKLNPGSMTFNGSEKAYYKTQTFKPVWV